MLGNLLLVCFLGNGTSHTAPCSPSSVLDFGLCLPLSALLGESADGDYAFFSGGFSSAFYEGQKFVGTALGVTCQL